MDFVFLSLFSWKAMKKHTAYSLVYPRQNYFEDMKIALQEEANPCRLLFLETWPGTLTFHPRPQSMIMITCLCCCLAGPTDSHNPWV